MRVLIVEDDVTLSRALSRMLVGHDLAVFSTAAEAIAELAARPAGAILTDYGIAPTDGIRLLQEVAVAHPTMRRYLMSGFEEARFDEHVASKLILRVFPKPIDLHALRAELARP
jgi:DNA-binding NtrC family response regulator